MKCPRCSQSKDVTRVDSDGKYHLCIKCNFSWATGKETEEKAADVNFRGLPTSQQFVEAFAKIENLDPVIKSAMEAQLTGLLMEQWIEGMKAGQLASIVHAKEYYKDKECPTPVEKFQQLMEICGVGTKIIHTEGTNSSEDSISIAAQVYDSLGLYVSHIKAATLNVDTRTMSLEIGL